MFGLDAMLVSALLERPMMKNINIKRPEFNDATVMPRLTTLQVIWIRRVDALE